MSKFKTMVKKDIELCDEYISKNMATHSEVNALLGKYVMDYPDFNKTCKYRSCSHVKEDGCEIINLVNKGKIPEWRYENYIKFMEEVKS